MSLCIRMLVNDRTYLLDSSEVKTVVGLEFLIPEQHPSGNVAGTVVIDQRVVPVLDLRQVLHSKSSRLYLNTRIVIPEIIGQVEAQFALIVEKVIDLIRLDRGEDGIEQTTTILYDKTPCYWLNSEMLANKALEAR